MNRILFVLLIIIISGACRNSNKVNKRMPVARAGDAVLYLDQIPQIVQPGTSPTDSSIIIQNYINRWAKKELLYQKAEDNLTPQYRDEINNQLAEARSNLVIYHYQRQMMQERMDTVITNAELESYYSSNQSSFTLSSNIVKALFIKIPVETPNSDRIRTLARSNEQTDLQELETLCFQFAEKFDDFNEKWVSLDRISVELPQEINNPENFLRRTTFYETADSDYLYFLTLRDYKLRSSLAPLEYVTDDIKRMIWNLRRIEFIQTLENGIYNDALKENKFTILNK